MLYTILILERKPSGQSAILSSVFNLSKFSYFTRSSVTDFMKFTATTIVDRLKPLSRESVEQEGYRCYSYLRGDNTAVVVFTDKDYPMRVAFSLINKVLDDYSKNCLLEPATARHRSGSLTMQSLSGLLDLYQDPAKADKITLIQKELDETTIILHKTLESVLERGEKMDDLVQRSEALSSTSKMFYKQSKEANSCCTWM